MLECQSWKLQLGPYDSLRRQGGTKTEQDHQDLTDKVCRLTAIQLGQWSKDERSGPTIVIFHSTRRGHTDAPLGRLTPYPTHRRK